MRVLWLLVLLLAYARCSRDACSEVTSTECSEDAPSIVFEGSLDSEEQCQSMCKAYSATPIGCTFSHWKPNSRYCRLYNEPLWAYLNHCEVLGGPPELGDCPVTHPEDSSCDGLRESECIYYGDVAEIIENADSWELCAAACSLNSHAAWTYRSEPKTECRLYTDNTKTCYESITPSKVDPKSCASHDIEGLLILGGLGAQTSVELWHPSLPPCRLPDLPRDMYGHTVNTVNSNIITCFKDTCEIFQAGNWLPLVTTTESRDSHSSVVHGDSVVLLGGYHTNTTEVIPSTGEAAVAGSYDIRHGRYHCTFDLSLDIAVITGGYLTYDLVTEYNKLSGSPRLLPPLQEGRYGHACSWYYQGQDKVLLVVGGYYDDPLASSETITYSTATMAAWTLHPSSLLPARSDPRASRIDDTVYVSGGYDDDVDYNDILTWDPEDSSWSKVGDMAVGRAIHAVTAVNYDIMSAFCVQL